MPVHGTSSGGYQWGNSGKVYRGKGAKRKAEKQARAIYASGWHEKSLPRRINEFIIKMMNGRS